MTSTAAGDLPTPAVAGWAISPQTADGLAHEIFGATPADDDVPRSLCGQFAGPFAWAPAEPGIERCQECQSRAAGTPD